MAPTLYCNSASGNCYKPRLLASLLNIRVEQIELDFFNNAHKSPDFLAINPKGELPTLVDGDRTFTDSSAILVYLAGSYPDREAKGQNGLNMGPSSYWSADVVEQAQIVDWLAFTASYVESGLCRARAIVSFSWPPDASDEIIQEAQSKGVASLKILEKRLETQKWLALGRPTIADVAIFVYVALAPMGGVSLEAFPSVRAWLERVKALPGFIRLDGLDQPISKK